MAVTYATVSSVGSGPGPRLRYEFYPETTNNTVTVAADDYIHVGPYSATTDAQGGFTIDLPTNTDQGGSTLVWRVVETPLTQIPQRGLNARVIGYFTIPASIDYDDLVASAIAPTVVTPTIIENVGNYAADAEAAAASVQREQANGVAGLDGSGKLYSTRIPDLSGTYTTKWAASTAYAAGAVVQAPDGSRIKRTSAGTSRATFDATEQALWTAVLATTGTMEQAAVAARVAATPTYVTSPTKNAQPSAPTYNVKAASLRNIRAALARVAAKTDSAKIVWIGDSTVAGHAVTPGTDDPATRLAVALQRRGYARRSEFTPAFNNVPTEGRYSETGAGWVSASAGSTIRKNISTSNVGKLANVGETSTTANIYGRFPEAWNYNVDGGAGTAGTVTAGTDITGQAVTITAGSAVKQVGFQRVSGSAIADPGTLVLGVEFFRPAPYGTRVFNLGVSGADSAELTDTFSATWTPKALAFLAPHLVIIQTGINDKTGSMSIATYTANVQTLINQATAVGADVILVAENDIQSSGGGLEPYWAALYQLAETNDIPVVDIYSRWGTWTAANNRGLMSGDVNHPSPAGYADMAAAMAEVIAPTTSPDPTAADGLGLWRDFTPSLTNCAGTVNYARYVQIGSLVRVQVKVTLSGAPTGNITIGLPVAARTGHPTTNDAPIGNVIGLDSGVAPYYGTATLQSVSPATLTVRPGSGLGAWNATSPFSWGSGDSIGFNAEYEAA